MYWHLSTGQLSTLYLFQLQTPLCHVSPLPHLFTPLYHQSQSTIHIVPLVGNRQNPSCRDLSYHVSPMIPCSPQASLVSGPRVPIPTPSSYTKIRSKNQMPNMPNTDIHMKTKGQMHLLPTSTWHPSPDPGACHRKAVLLLCQMGQSLALHLRGT